MKNLPAILLLLLSFVIRMSAQSPQAFKYQTVIRDKSGNPFKNATIGIKISILEGSENGQSVYSEAHNKNTNEFGLVNIEIGRGKILEGKFDSIPWGKTTHFLKIDLDTYNTGSYEFMGTTQLLSVPYALFAESTNQTDGFWQQKNNNVFYSKGNVGIGIQNPDSKLEVVGDQNANPDACLFAVKDELGDTVFAVFKNGVSIYLEANSLRAKPKGFIVKSKSRGKRINTDSEILRVTSDSVIVYLDNTGTRAKSKGFIVKSTSKSRGTKGSEILRITEDSTRIYTQDTVAGFGVSNKVNGKTENYMRLSPQNYFIGHQSGLFTQQLDYDKNAGKYNTFLGYQTGYKNSTGQSNVLLGYKSGYSNTTGSWNVLLGNYTGYNNNSGISNVFIGEHAGYSHTKGSYNVFLGSLAGFYDSIGVSNVFLGDQAGYYNKEGTWKVYIGHQAGYSDKNTNMNIFIGGGAGYSHVEGERNVFVGQSAGYMDSTSQGNVFVGFEAGQNHVTGNQNVYVGESAGYDDKYGQKNTFVGFQSGLYNRGDRNTFYGNASGIKNLVGQRNTFIGNGAGFTNEFGSSNTFIGNLAGDANSAGNYNLCAGDSSGFGNRNGHFNVYLGHYTAANNYDGSRNIFIGNKAGYFETGSNKLYIDNSGRDKDNALIYGEFDKKILHLNATVNTDKINVKQVVNLKPLSEPPTSPEKGTMYMDNTDNKLKVWDGSTWQSCW